jgi:tetratricopeptide (TPR) repeat protein
MSITRRIDWRLAAALAALTVLAGCTSLSLAPRPTAPPAPAPAPSGEAPSAPPAEDAPAAARPRGTPSSASQALLGQARTERAAGRYDQAISALERALRIDPNNPLLWIELGETHLQAGDSAQAAAMARKALTLAGGERAIENQAERLLRAASTR